MARVVSKSMQRVKPAGAARQSGAGAAAARSPPTRLGPIDADRRRAMIAEAAYYRSLSHRGSELEHWLAAEREVDAQVMSPGSH
jgi:hypothetical protein